MTEFEKMIKGELYDQACDELSSLRAKCSVLCNKYNRLKETNPKKRNKLLTKLMPNASKKCFIKGPIYLNYGINTSIGDRTYINFNCVILDVCKVNIGNDCFIGPNASIMTPMHALHYKERNKKEIGNNKLFDLEYGKPVTIEDNVWLASNVTVLPGVTIGNGSVIGAGSVVTHDIPPMSLAYGNPCKVIRQITEDDYLYLKK